jgi:hypothetical protein
MLIAARYIRNLYTIATTKYRNLATKQYRSLGGAKYRNIVSKHFPPIEFTLIALIALIVILILISPIALIIRISLIALIIIITLIAPITLITLISLKVTSSRDSRFASTDKRRAISLV